MASSPPGSPPTTQRPMSAMIRAKRSSSRMSISEKHVAAGSRASDEDGKTAVKVAVRVRPPLKPTDPGFELIPQRFRGSTVSVTTPTSLAVESGQGKKLFVFDRVFGEDVDQNGVWDYLKESVNSFVEGYNVSILAYGQSGAGKSYTMGTTGPSEQGDASLMGVVPRAASALFEKLIGASNRMSTSGLKSPKRYSTLGFQSLTQPQQPAANRNWQMWATYVEIYQEQLRDLLVPETVPASERPQIAIREDTKGRILLTGLKKRTISSVEDLLEALNFGSSIRQTDATAVNARSSRSHAVFSLELVQRKSKVTSVQDKRRSVPLEAMSAESWVTIDSKLHFVDLAGSERLKNTQAFGERAKEGISINAGLASLGKVIAQLSSRHAGSHVSYRDSRLTRLLQDSLGGNAITYMVACVNPAEFHLSETLNTVQYAQRARAIQSKPQIQQVHEDGDKQAAIDRLRAEVSFLRDQIRLSERAGRRDVSAENGERHGEREQQLQNQLLDIQENYRALSNRHAKLIAEITKTKDGQDSEALAAEDTAGQDAMARIKRSTDFGEAVEQVVLEYEKTIHSLETSLSSTRSTLAVSESSLLEKETSLAFMESQQKQLQARVQKAMDREENDKQYLADLEARVAGATSGEEKSAAVVQSLRGELARARENESSCEDYISTLEERLAESEQDQEIREREIQRLEHVIERQRSIGKLDNLLYELDNIRRSDSKQESRPLTNGHSKDENFEPVPEEGPAQDGERAPEVKPVDGDVAAAREVTTDGMVEEDSKSHEAADSAQSRYVADKLEAVTQELFELRVDHETTVNDYAELEKKYQVALQTLAQVQEKADASKEETATPSSLLADAQANEVASGERDTLAAEGQAAETVKELNAEEPEAKDTDSKDGKAAEMTIVGTVAATAGAALGALVGKSTSTKNISSEEYATLQKSHTEQGETLSELSRQYVELQDRHQETLDHVEDLKAEVQRASMARPSSPVTMLRRKSSQAMQSEKANRSAAALRTLANESFEDQPERIQTFETNITALVHELQNRSERVASLEGDLSSVREEMENKMKIISGLTRERSSMKATTPIDISVVASMQDQLHQSEAQIRNLQEAHGAREQELQGQIDSLKAAITTDTTSGADATQSTKEVPVGGATDHEARLTSLQSEVEDWKAKHEASVQANKASEEQMQSTIRSLEASLKKAEEARVDSPTASDEKDKSDAAADATAAPATSGVVASLRQKVEEYKNSAAENATRLATLDMSYQNILKQVEQDAEARKLTEKELQTHKDLVSNLETQLLENQRSLTVQTDGLQSIKDTHANEINEVKAKSARDVEEARNRTNTAVEEARAKASSEADAKLAAQMKEHQKALSTLKEDLSKAQGENSKASAGLQDELKKAQSQLLHLVDSLAVAMNQETDVKSIESHVRQLANERKTLMAEHENVTSELMGLRKDFDTSQKNVDTLETKLEELKKINEETANELLRVGEDQNKKSRLVEELEDQLNKNYDSHQATNNRLSLLQTQRQVNLDEALQGRLAMEQELEDAKAKIVQLEAQIGDKRSSQRGSREGTDSAASHSRLDSTGADANLRRSTSHNSLPSPPPAIPLPPLPGSPPSVPAPSPPTSRHTSKDMAQAQLVEDQEARIRTIEKHLFAEKQLTATLEEALTDLEGSSTKLKNEMEGWRRKCVSLEEELGGLRKERNNTRLSVQQLEEERTARMRIEAERANLEQRMAQLNMQKKKKKSSINCF